MNELTKLLVWQMAQVLGYEGQVDLAEHAVLLLADYDTNTCQPIFIGKQFLSDSFDPSVPWDRAVKGLASNVVSEEYKKECALFFSENAARRKFEKGRVYDSINYVSQLSGGQKWTHCIQSIFSSTRSIQEIRKSFTAEASFLASPGIFFPSEETGSLLPDELFTPEESADDKAHLMAYFLVIEIDAIRKSIESLQYLARHDQLTGLYNRHMMAEIVNDDPSAIIILDIDNFKGINDTYGHEAGDEALCSLAGRLEAVFWQPQRDLVFRLGGDEFLVVMKDASEEEVKDRLNKLCEPIRFTTDDNRLITFTVSAGYAFCDGDYKAAMKKADEALYSVKNGGKGCFARAGDC